jgi:hypothetical protein
MSIQTMYTAKKKTINEGSTTRCEEFRSDLGEKARAGVGPQKKLGFPKFSCNSRKCKNEFSGASTNRQKEMTAAL